jgi:hypothetical protein
VFANDYTAAPYTALSDGEIRESDLIALLLESRLPAEAEANNSIAASARLPSAADLDASRKEIVAEVVAGVRAARQPVPLEALADRAVRTLGHERTVGSAWGGTGSFRDLLLRSLPEEIRISEQPPYYVFDASRQIAAERPALESHQIAEASLDPRAPAIHVEPAPRRVQPAPAAYAEPQPQPLVPAAPPAAMRPVAQPGRPVARVPQPAEVAPSYPSTPPPQSAQRGAVPTNAGNREGATAIQQSIARIHEACQAPPLSPPEYRVLFEVMAKELTENGLTGAQTLVNITERARELGLDLKRDDLRFVLDVVSEADPWFEQGASATLFASRFRNFVIARCRGQGLSLSVDELDLIEAWFAGSGGAAQRGRAAANAPAPARAPVDPAPQQAPSPAARQPAYASAEPRYAPEPTPAAMPATAQAEARADRWWTLEEGRQHVAEQRNERFAADGAPTAAESDEFPRIVRSRLRV